MKPSHTLVSAALCLIMMPLCTWAAEPIQTEKSAQDASSQAERERIVRALVEGDDKTASSFQDVTLPTVETPPSTATTTTTPAIASGENGKTSLFEVTRRDAEASVGIALAAAGASELTEADIIKPINTILYKHDKPLKIEVKTLQFDPKSHLWNGNLLLIDETGNVVTAMPASGRWQELKSVPSLKHTIRAGEMIKEEDIVQMHYPASRLHDDNVVDASELIGKTPRRSISNSRPIRKNEVQAPAMVKKGATVTMHYNTPAMSITTIGQTLQDGGKGELIRVKNIDSNAIVQASVLSENEVQVGGFDGINTNVQAVILSPAKKDVVVQAGKEVAIPLTPTPQTTASPAPAATETPAPEPQQALPTENTADSAKSAEPAQSTLANPTLQQPIPITRGVPSRADIDKASEEEKKKQELKEKMVRDAFMNEEGMTPTKALESLNPDDMILAPKKMFTSPELPDLDPTKPRDPANPFKGMTP